MKNTKIIFALLTLAVCFSFLMSSVIVGGGLTLGGSGIGSSGGIGSSETIGGSGTIGDSATIGDSVTIGESATIGDSVTIGESAELIKLPPVTGDEFEVEDPALGLWDEIEVNDPSTDGDDAAYELDMAYPTNDSEEDEADYGLEDGANDANDGADDRNNGLFGDGWGKDGNPATGVGIAVGGLLLSCAAAVILRRFKRK